jgi:predicted aspartyl protease
MPNSLWIAKNQRQTVNFKRFERLSSVILAFAVALIIGSGCKSVSTAFVPREVELPAGAAVVPFALEDGLPFVEVMINGCGPFKMLLDTGWEMSVVTRSVADELGLPEPRTRYMDATATGAEAKPFPFKVVTISEMTLGEAHFRGFDVQARDLGSLEQTGVVLDGILGFPVFKECLLTVDFPRKELRIERGALRRASDWKRHFFEHATISGGVPRIPVLVGFDTPNATLFDLIVDTGYNGSMTLPDEAKSLEIPMKFIGESTGTTIHGEVRSEEYQLETKIIMGGYMVENPVIEYRADKALIGTAALGSMAVTFDQKNRIVRFTMPEQEDTQKEE